MSLSLSETWINLTYAYFIDELTEAYNFDRERKKLENKKFEYAGIFSSVDEEKNAISMLTL